MTAISGLPGRPLTSDELLQLEEAEAIEFTCPMVLRYPDLSIHGAIIVKYEEVVAIVLEDGEWRVHRRKDRPVPPVVFENILRNWCRPRDGYFMLQDTEVGLPDRQV